MRKVFILGNPRSVTSLLRLMMNSHSLVVSPPESGFLHWWSKKYADWQQEDVLTSRMKEFIGDLATSKKIETWNLNFAQLQEYLFSKRPASYAELGEQIYAYYGIASGKKPTAVVDKNNYYIHHLKELKQVWPDAYFIHLVRDGRDVACSYLEMKSINSDSIYKPVLTDDISKIAMEWKTNNQRIFDFLSTMEPAQVKVIRYEDLILDSRKTLGEVCHFLNMSFDQNMLNYHEEKNHDEPAQTMDWKKRTLDPPDKERVGRYKNSLSAIEITQFNSIAGEILQKFSYSV